MHKHTYTPATALVDMSDADAVAQIMAIHTAQFGGYRMDDEPGDEGEQASSFTDPATGEKYGFPAETATKDMTADQRSEYWRHKARKHEDTSKSRADYDAIKAERDQLRAAGMSDAENAIEDARAAAANEARLEERGKLAGQIAHARLHGALSARGLKDEQITAIVTPLNPHHFLTDTGEVDAAKVSSFVDSLGVGAANRQWPDTGQGKRGSGEPAKSVGAGRDLFRDKHTKK